MAIDFAKLRTFKEARAAVEKEERKGRGTGDIVWYKLPKDTTPITIRVLPPKGNSFIPGKYVKKHFSLPQDEVINCFKMYGKECPVCNVIDDYRHKVDVSKIESNESAYIPVLVYNDPKHPEIPGNKPVVLQTSGYMLNWIIDQLTAVTVVNGIEMPVVGDLTDPVHGHNLVLQRTGMNKKFNKTIMMQAMPIAHTQEQIDAILAGIPDLDKVFKEPTDEDFMNASKLAMELKSVFENTLMVGGGVGQANMPPYQAMVEQQPAPTGHAAAYPQIQPEILQSPVTQDVEFPWNETPVPTQTPASFAREMPKQAPVAQAQAPIVTKPMVAQSNIRKPDGAPDCYATLAYNPTAEKCLNCSFEFYCEEAIRGLKK